MRPNVNQQVLASIGIESQRWSYVIRSKPSMVLDFANMFQPIDVKASWGGLIMNGNVAAAPAFGFNFSICIGNRIGSCFL